MSNPGMSERIVAVIYPQLYRASALFETIRHEAQHSTDYKLSLFDLQTSCYQALQRVLVSLGTSTHFTRTLSTARCYDLFLLLPLCAPERF